LVIGFYFIYQLRDWIIPPELSVETPTDGASLQGPDIVVEGNATPGVHLTVNGVVTYNEETGHFYATLLFPAGLHTIEIVAKNRFGRTQSIQRQIVVEELKMSEPAMRDTQTATSTEGGILLN